MTHPPQTTPPKATGLRRVINAIGYSRDGLIATFRDEAAFRQELMACLALIPLACYLAPDKISLVLLIGSLFPMLCMELINSAIEAAIDRFGPEHNPLAKKAKDAGSAAVLMAIFLACFTWAIVLVF